MSISHHSLLLIGVQALALGCAHRAVTAATRPALSDAATRNIESDLRVARLHSAASPASNPYTPVRSSNASLYSWQSETRADCPPESSPVKAESERPLTSRAARGMLGSLPEQVPEPVIRTQPVSSELVVAQLRPALRQCFSRWLNERVDAAGSVRFVLELGCGGEVVSISAENQGVDETTLRCLFSAVAPARFAPPAGGRATVLVPVVFKNTGR